MQTETLAGALPCVVTLVPSILRGTRQTPAVHFAHIILLIAIAIFIPSIYLLPLSPLHALKAR